MPQNTANVAGTGDFRQKQRNTLALTSQRIQLLLPVVCAYSCVWHCSTQKMKTLLRLSEERSHFDTSIFFTSGLPSTSRR